MLYDPKWEKTETKADPMTLEALIAWLEKQPQDKTYCYGDTGGCLLHSYLTECGFKNVLVGGVDFAHGNDWEMKGTIPPAIQDIPLDMPRTYGAALERARAALRS